MKITRHGRWQVENFSQHNEQPEAFENAANKSKELGRPVNITPPSYEVDVEFFEGIQQTTSSPTVDPDALYVATDGVDDAGRDGSISQPWATLSYAFTRLVGGETVYVRSGSYSGSGFTDLEPPSGSSGNPTTITKYPLDGGIPLLECNDSGQTRVSVFKLDKSYVTLSYLECVGGGYSEWGTIVIGDAANASDIIIDNCTIRDANRYGDPTNSNPCMLRIRYGAASVSNITVTNNTIYHSTSNTEASAIKFDARVCSNITIHNNHLYNTIQAVGVKWGDTTDRTISIKHNKIHDVSQRGVYADQGYMVIQHNLIYRCSDNGIVAHDNFAGNNLNVQFNTVVDCRIDIRGGSAVATNGTFKNNILYFTGSAAPLRLFPFSASAHSSVTGYNQYYTTSGTNAVIENSTNYTVSGWESYHAQDVGNSAHGDPLFTSYAGDDFTIDNTSPAWQAAEGGVNMGCDFTLLGPQ